MFQLLLRDAGYRVSTVGSGEELLQFLKVLSPDVILLDISLPGINGVDATRQIKSDPERGFIPIILITALGDMKTKVAGLDAGADDFLVKPVEFAELLARVRAMMRLQHSRRGLQEAKQRMEVLLDFSQMLSTSIDVETLAHRVVVQLRDAVGAIRGSIILINERHDPVVVSTTQQSIDTPMLAKILRDGVAGWVIRAGKPLLLSDARMDQRWIRSQRMLDVTSSVSCVPILHNQTVLGVITLVHNRVNYFNQEHIDLMQSMAAQSAVALLNARLFSLTNQQKAQLEHRSHHLEEILTVGERLRLNLPLETALNEIAEAIRRSLGFERVMVQILSSATGGEAVRGKAGPRAAGDLPGDELTDAALLGLLASPAIKRQRLSRSSLVPAADDDSQAPRPGQPAQPGDRLLTPVGAPGSLLGAILADLPPESAVPALETIQSLEVFADQVSGAVQNSRVFAREQQRANQLQLLVDVSRSLTELMTPDQVGRLVTSLIQHTFGFFSVAMLLREQTTLVLRATADAA
ncbi:MAG TPA: response regulator, partial [Herpetosiphonaceae bacterium]